MKSSPDQPPAARSKPTGEVFPSSPGALAHPGKGFSKSNRRTSTHPVQRAYPFLLVATTGIAATFCLLYISKPVILTAPAEETRAPTPSSNQPLQAQEKFYEALIAKLEKLQDENRDLVEQVAETHRELMKLESRVDAQSEQIRPLTENDASMNVSFADDPGVLPPREESAQLPAHE